MRFSKIPFSAFTSELCRELFILTFLCCTTVVLTGCAAFTSPKEHPAIEDKIGENFGVLSVTAERRAIIFGRAGANAGRICAEPSPDVAESLVSSLKVIAEATAKRGDIEAKAGFEFGKSLATAVSTLFVRSQGIQFMRDSTYALCQAHLNGMLTEAQFLVEYTRISNLAYVLIEKEIPNADTKRAEAAATRAEAASASTVTQVALAKVAQDAAKASADSALATAAQAKAAAAKTIKDATK